MEKNMAYPQKYGINRRKVSVLYLRITYMSSLQSVILKKDSFDGTCREIVKPWTKIMYTSYQKNTIVTWNNGSLVNKIEYEAWLLREKGIL